MLGASTRPLPSQERAVTEDGTGRLSLFAMSPYSTLHGFLLIHNFGCRESVAQPKTARVALAMNDPFLI